MGENEKLLSQNDELEKENKGLKWEYHCKLRNAALFFIGGMILGTDKQPVLRELIALSLYSASLASLFTYFEIKGKNNSRIEENNKKIDANNTIIENNKAKILILNE